MRTYLSNAPPWVLGLVHGTYFAVAMTVVFGLQGRSWGAAASGGVVAGVLFGAFSGPSTARRFARTRDAVGSLDSSDRRLVGRAAWRGPVPADPEVRETAERLARHSHDELARQRTATVIVALFFTALAAYLSVTSSTWWAAVGVLFLALLGGQIAYERHLARRVERLSA